MPYIKQENRSLLDPTINHLISMISRNIEISDGEVNYAITSIIDKIYSKKDYAHYNRALGILEAVKQEYYRRKVGPFEDLKMKDNGDVYR